MAVPVIMYIPCGSNTSITDIFMELIKEYSTGSLLNMKLNNLGRLEKILLHPLSLCFLHFKWQQTRFCFYFLLCSHIVFSMTYSGYVVILYNTICDPLEWRDRQGCHMA